MSKFNTATARPAARSPIVTQQTVVCGTSGAVGETPAARSPIVTQQTPSGRTYEGAPGYARGDAKSELFLLAVANFVAENTFYESAADRDARYASLVRQVALEDPQWMLDFLRWLRSEGNMRSAPLVGALEAAKAMVAAQIPGSRRIVASVLQRADEPGEALAYWTSRYGRSLPKPVKRGIADAALRLYAEYPWLKYDTSSHGVRFGDVLNLTHPGDQDGSSQRRLFQGRWQRDLFVHVLNKRHGRRHEPTPETLRMVRANEELRALLAEDPFSALDAERIRAAGMTWEDVLSLLGSKRDKGELWTALIPTMGFMACLRNLRNFDEAGLSDEVAAKVAARLSDPDEVARSRQFPFRFLAAYRATLSLRWGQALETALNLSLANVPELPGRTLVLVDRSGSMFGTVSGRSGLNRADQAALFGAALALRNIGRVDLVQFGDTSCAVSVNRGDSLLRVVNERFANLGGTYTARAVRQHYNKHDRVVIVTDEQAHDGNPGGQIPAKVPLYTWNVAGYQYGHGPGTPYRHTFAGMTDAAFRMIPLLEAGRDGKWPWLD